MELDLSKYNATSLEIKVNLQVGKSELSALNQCYPEHILKKVDDFIEFGSDKILKERNYSARGLVRKTASKKFEIYLYYVSVTLGKLSGLSKLQPLSKMLSCLANIKKNLTFEVTAQFGYPVKKFKSRIALPIKLADDEIFDEVRGMRLVKLADGKNLFTLIVDRPDNKNIYHVVVFSYVGNISDTLPKTIFDEAISISKRGLYE